MPLSSLYLLKWRFLLFSVKSRYSAGLYSVASGGFLLGKVFLGNIESPQILLRRMAGHSHCGDFEVCHVFERYSPWFWLRVMHLSFSTT